MANDCSFRLKAAAENKETLDRLLSIMKYEDKEFYIYRVRDVYVDMEPNNLESKEGRLWTIGLMGDVAWSANPWVKGVPNPNDKSETGAGYTNLVELCKTLGMGVEIWTSEPGMSFQEHILVNRHGEVEYDTADWQLEYDEETDEPIESGGFSDFERFNTPEEILG
jgi:hypothetical protein